MKEIFERRSIRKYLDKPIPNDLVEKLLKAAMAAPTAVNQQEWQFIVINKRDILDSITKIHSSSQMLKQSPLAIAVCADLEKATHKEFWVQDCSAATQNILLEAQHLGLGAVWLGFYPYENRVAGIRNILKLPQNIMPLSLVALGYPSEEKAPIDRFDKAKIHMNIW